MLPVRRGLGRSTAGIKDELLLLQEAVDGLVSSDRTTKTVEEVAELVRGCGQAGCLALGRRVHEYIGGAGRLLELGGDGVFLGNLLVQMYGSCGSLAEAWSVFGSMEHRNLFSWNIMFSACARNGAVGDAAELFEAMPHRNVVSWNSMMAVAARGGALSEARRLFEVMPQRSLVSWNSMAAGYSQHGGAPRDAIALFRTMALDGVPADTVCTVTAIDACARACSLPDGRAIAAVAAEAGFDSCPTAGDALIAMYGRCGAVAEAQSAFDRLPAPQGIVSWTALVSAYAQNGRLREAAELFEAMPERNAITWTAMITGHTQRGRGDVALRLFRAMNVEGVEGDAVALAAGIDAAAACGDVAAGAALHAEVWAPPTGSGLGRGDAAVGNALINMYAKCGLPASARQCFLGFGDMDMRRDVVSWTAALAAASADCAADESAAVAIFEAMPQRSVVSWNAMVTAHARAGDTGRAMALFRRMLHLGLSPDRVTFMLALEAAMASPRGALALGRHLHGLAAQRGLHLDPFVASALLDMYGKCGCLDSARSAFEVAAAATSAGPDLVLWSTLVDAYAGNGHGRAALSAFYEMLLDGVAVNGVTLMSVLSACDHVGLVDDGLEHLARMADDHGISADQEHIVCMADILGRAGRLSEAQDMLLVLPASPALALAWKSLLACCKSYGDVRRAESIARRVFHLDPVDGSPHIMLSNIYAADGQSRSGLVVSVKDKPRRDSHESIEPESVVSDAGRSIIFR